jgi:hypothetical protein
VGGEAEQVVAIAVLKPASGRAITGTSQITAANLHEFSPAPGDAEAVAEALRRAGCQVGPLVGIAMSLAGPRDAFERYFGVTVRPAEDGGWVAGDAGARELPVPEELADRVQAVTFEPPAEAVAAP